MNLPPRKPRKRVETDIVRETREAIGNLPWCVVWRNNTGALPDARGRIISYGLCEGSSDLIGIVQFAGPAAIYGNDPLTPLGWTVGPRKQGRFFAAEMKQPGKKPTKEQTRFIEVVRSFGGAADWFTSADDVVAWLERVRTLQV